MLIITYIQVKHKLVETENQLKNPPIKKTLEHEIENMKCQYQRVFSREQARSENAERKILEMSKSHEQRVASLEAAIAELSSLTGNHDNDTQDLINKISSLEEKLYELSGENTNLRSKCNLRGVLGDNDLEKLVDGFVYCVQRMTYIKALSSDENKKLIEDSFDNSILHEKCKLESSELKKQIEEMSPKTEDFVDKKPIAELEKLENKIKALKLGTTDLKLEHSKKITELTNEMKNQSQDYESRMKTQLYEHKLQVSLNII